MVEIRRPINKPMKDWPNLYLDSGVVPAPHITLMFRAEKLDGLRFDPKLRLTQDKEFAYRVFKKLNVEYVDKIVYNYERRPSTYLRKLKKRIGGIKNSIYLINTYHPRKGIMKSIAKRTAWDCLKLVYEAFCLNKVVSPSYISSKILNRENIKSISPLSAVEDL